VQLFVNSKNKPKTQFYHKNGLEKWFVQNTKMDKKTVLPKLDKTTK
jgi:hypothetical protein